MTTWRRRLTWALVLAIAFVIGWLSRFFPDWSASVATAFLDEQTSRAWMLAATITQTIVLIASVLYAAMLYSATHRTAAQKNTLEKIFEEHGDEDVVKQRLKYRQIRDDASDRLSNYAGDVKAFRKKKWEEFQTEQRTATYDSDGERKEAEIRQHTKIQKLEDEWLGRQVAVQGVLNRYETFAIGIRAKAIDESMYRLWWKTQLIKDWHASRELILELQKVNPNAYIEFSALAQKWEREDLTQRRDAQQ